MEQKLFDAASGLPEASLQFDEIGSTPVLKHSARPVRSWKRIAAAAACLLLLVSLGLGTYAYAAEAKEYNDAVRFFNNYRLSTEGLSRGEIKAVYRDITTESFTYSKTAEVIRNSLSSGQVEGFDIWQEDPTPEDMEILWWNYKNFTGSFAASPKEGVHYEYRVEYRIDPDLGFEALDKSYIEKYDGEELIWSTAISEFRIDGFNVVSDGVIVYGNNYRWSSSQASYAWMAKIDANGDHVWTKMLNNGFKDEYIAEVLENADGSYAVISRGDLAYFCLSQYDPDGTQTFFRKTEIGNYGIWNAARFGDGYIVQLGSYITNEHASIVKVDREGNITESFSYSSEDAYYYIADMIEFDGKIYLSAYAVPRLADEGQSAGGRYEIAAVLNHVFDNKLFNISSEELTPLVRNNYTAILLVCDPNAGTPQEFFSVKGSLGGELSVSDSGTLVWEVESITATFLSIATSSFTIGGTTSIYRYAFDQSGMLISQEKTGEYAGFRR